MTVDEMYDSRCEGCGGCGVRVPATPDCEFDETIPPGWVFVERCDECELYDSDEDAAWAINATLVGHLECRDGNPHLIALWPDPPEDE